jgi:hypothetical protein
MTCVTNELFPSGLAMMPPLCRETVLSAATAPHSPSPPQWTTS